MARKKVTPRAKRQTRVKKKRSGKRSRNTRQRFMETAAT